MSSSSRLHLQDQEYIKNLYSMITLVIFASVVNPLLIWWQVYYVTCTVSPLSHQGKVTNQDRYNLQTEFASICILGLMLSILNGLVAFLLLDSVCMGLGGTKAWIDSKTEMYAQSVAGKLLAFFWKFFALVVLLVAAMVVVFIAFGQFLTPFVTPDIMWGAKYKRTCNGFDVRAFLDSTSSRPARSILFGDLTSRTGYTMAMDPDPGVWGFDEHGVYNFSVVSIRNTNDGIWGVGEYGVYNLPVVPAHNPNDMSIPTLPKFGRIKYDLRTGTLEAYSSNETLKSSFGLGSNFSIPGIGVRGDIEPFSRRCVFDPTVEIFQDTLDEKGEKKLVVKTAQLTICGQLQVCADQRIKDNIAVVVGLLVLQRAGRPGKCCKGRVMPGVAGRDYGRDGRG